MSNYYITYMWREAPETQKDKVYRFQTNDPEINLRMEKRKDFKLAVVGLNEKLWIYKTKIYSLKEAKDTLTMLTFCRINFRPIENIFVTQNGFKVKPGEQYRMAF